MCSVFCVSGNTGLSLLRQKAVRLYMCIALKCLTLLYTAMADVANSLPGRRLRGELNSAGSTVRDYSGIHFCVLNQFRADVPQGYRFSAYLTKVTPTLRSMQMWCIGVLQSLSPEDRTVTGQQIVVLGMMSRCKYEAIVASNSRLVPDRGSTETSIC